MRPATRLVLLSALAAFGVGGCAAGPDATAPVGSRSNPLVCAGRPDQLAYLARLRCPDASAPDWQAVGDGPIGPYGAPLDRYLVRCPDLDRETWVYFDRRHRPIGDLPVPDGLSLAPAGPESDVCGMTDGCSEP
jgi:hypothetical protein